MKAVHGEIKVGGTLRYPPPPPHGLELHFVLLRNCLFFRGLFKIFRMSRPPPTFKNDLPAFPRTLTHINKTLRKINTPST